MEIIYSDTGNKRQHVFLMNLILPWPLPLPEIGVRCCGEPIRIVKEYGPLIACDVRVRLDAEAAEWVVEKEIDNPCFSDSITAAWVEVVRFSCQLSDADSATTDSSAGNGSIGHFD